MEEDRERIEALKSSLSISRLAEVNPHPIQLYRGDLSLGSRPKTFQLVEGRTFRWLDDLEMATRKSLVGAIKEIS